MSDNNIANQLNNAATGENPVNIYANLLDKHFLNSLQQMRDDVKAQSIKELKDWITRTSTYQWDFKNIMFDNLTKEQNELIAEYNFFNKMVNKHLINTKIKLEQGQSVISWRVGNGKLIPEVLELIGTPKEDNGEYIEVFGTKNQISQMQNQEQLTFYRYYKENGKVFVQTYVAPFDKELKQNPKADEKYKQGKAYEFKQIDYLPLEIFNANESATPEWKYVENSINIAGTFNEQLFIEWKYIRTQLINNINFNPTKTSKDVKKDIEEDNQRIHDMYDQDGQMQQALSYLSNGGVTVDIARGVIDHYKEQIKDFLFMIGRTAGGNNKHNTEAMNDNVNAYSYIWTKKTLLSEEISRLYYKWADMSSKYNFVQFGELPKYFKGEMQLSRSLEILLNLNAEGKEKDNETTEFLQIRKNENSEGVE